MIEGHLTVSRTARYYALWEPGRVPWVLWVVVHGYRQAASRFLTRFKGIASPGRRIVAPEGLSRFYIDEDGGPHGPEHRVGASWMTREDRDSEIRDYVGYLDTLVEALVAGPDGAPARIVVLGFSQGGHTAARWVSLGRVRTSSPLVLWGSSLPVDLDPGRGMECLRESGVILVRGTRDPHAPAHRLKSEVDRLQALRIPYRVVEHPGGHEIHEPTLNGLSAEIEEGLVDPASPEE
jgi:predicted esterase